MRRNTIYICTIICLSLTLIINAHGQVPCSGITSLSECPDTGCGAGDGELNKRKNRTTPPSSPVSRTLNTIRNWSQPASWTSGQSRDSLAFREDKGVVVMAYLHDARRSGKETTNCKLGGVQNNDFHLDLVSNRNAPRASAVTAEITPRLRPEGWSFEKLEHLGEWLYFVRVTGWIMLDTAHISSAICRSMYHQINQGAESLRTD